MCKHPLVDFAVKKVFLEKYTKMALEGSNEDFFVSDENGYTKIMLQILLNNYNQSVKILGTSLCNKILGDEQCRKVLEKSAYPVDIILTNYPNITSQKIKNYFSHNFYENVSVKEISSNLVIPWGDSKKEIEFLVLDNKSYLYEINFEHEEKITKGNFNDPKEASYLYRKFNEIYNPID